MNIIESLISFLKNIGNVTWQYQLYIGLGVLVLLLVFSIIRSNRSYEVRLLKSINKLNKFFVKNPNITKENLVQFNNMMRKVPNTLRYCWYEYLLNRDKLPSEYMGAEQVIDKPSMLANYKNTTKHLKSFTLITSLALFLLSFGYVAFKSATISVADIFITAAAIPLLVLIFGLLFVTFMETRYSALTSDLYYSYHDFERNINKACSTLTFFIDYEVLFTKKEIQQGLPVVQEYLEKRDLLEKQAKENEAINNVPFEKYDFEKLGVDNSLLIDRAMLESEKYINVKRNLSERIKAKQIEMENHQKQFDEVTRDYEKKSQVSKESLNQLSEQIRATSVKIEASYLGNRLDKERAKLQQLNKDYEMAQSAFKKDQDAFQAEIDKFQAEIEKRKTQAEEAMIAECQTYVNKVYSQVTDAVIHQTEPVVKDLEDKQLELQESVNKLESNIEEKTTTSEQLQNRVDELEGEYQKKLSEIQGLQNVKEYFTSADFAEYMSGQKFNKSNGISAEQNADILNAMQKHEDLMVENEKLKSANNNLNIVNEKLENKSQELTVNIDALTDAKNDLQAENDRLQAEYESLSQSLSDTIDALADGQAKLAELNAARKKLKENESNTAIDENVENAYKEVDSLKKSLSRLKSSVDKAKNNSTKTITNKARVSTRAKKAPAETETVTTTKRKTTVKRNGTKKTTTTTTKKSKK